jgi:hypothetical protein
MEELSNMFRTLVEWFGREIVEPPRNPTAKQISLNGLFDFELKRQQHPERNPLAELGDSGSHLRDDHPTAAGNFRRARRSNT